MADPTIRIRLEDAGSSGGPPVNQPMPGRGGGSGGRGGLPMPGGGDSVSLHRLLGMPEAIVSALKGGLAAYGFKAGGQYLSNMAGDLSRYSGDLAGAKANSDLRNMQAEMNRAQRLGPDLARFERRWNELMNSFYELGTKILEILLKLFDAAGPVFDFFSATGSRISAFIDLWVKIGELIHAYVTGQDDAWKARLWASVDEIIRRFWEGGKKNEVPEDFWLKELDKAHNAIPDPKFDGEGRPVFG